MIPVFHKSFIKDLKKADQKIKSKAYERLQVFAISPNSLILKKHALKGKYTGYYSINITGDVRAVYKLITPKDALFVKLANHNQLYS